MKRQNIVRCSAAFAWGLSAVMFVVLMQGAVVAQEAGLSATAEGLSSSASGMGASARGLSSGEVGGRAVGSNAGVGATANGREAGLYDVDSAPPVYGTLTSGLCGETYRDERKRGQKPGSRLGCKSRP